MGNRAVIQIENDPLEIYLHWNGGRDSVEPMVAYAREQGIRSGDYGVARLCQIIGNTLGGTLSLGVAPKGSYSGDEDNGTYVLDNEFNIVGRKGLRVGFTEQSVYPYEDMLRVVREKNDKHFRSALGELRSHSKKVGSHE